MEQKPFKKPFILGIDPGLSGALALLNPTTNLAHKIWDFPLSPQGAGGKNIINASILAAELSAIIGDVEIAIIEDVHAMPGQGVTSMFGFGVSKGLVIGMLHAFKCPVFTVPPAVWKGVYGLSSNKDASRALASKKFPNSSYLWTRKKDDGRAEALLLADFGRRFY